LWPSKRPDKRYLQDFHREFLRSRKSQKHKKKNELHHTQHPENQSLRGREMEHPVPRTTGEKQQMQRRKLFLASNPSQQIKGPLREESGLTERRIQRWRGWRQNPLT
jgi:hypothetical protein